MCALLKLIITIIITIFVASKLVRWMIDMH